MAKVIFGALFVVLALGGGLVGGHYVQAMFAPQTTAEDGGSSAPPQEPSVDDTAREYARLSNQFVVPVMKGDRVSALVALSISLEVPEGKTPSVLAREPKIQDAFLQVLFDHANAGGFLGSFTDGDTVLNLRRALLEKAKGVLGPDVIDVLITDMARQDS